MEGFSSETLIYESVNYKVYRAIRESDGVNCIIKVSAESSVASSEKLESEYKLLKEVDSAYVVKALDFERTEEQSMLILEDIEGISLHDLLEERKLKTATFLDYALMITEGIKALHSFNIIHKDINPTNIIVHEKEYLVKIIDLNISQKYNPFEHKENNFLEGTPEYISPEQTGHLQTQLDLRSDLYSLGITFYEMLTGNLPFVYSDTSELIHAHIAKQAVSPQERNPKIPEMLSQITMKLIAKNPADRYQSILGLKKDLEKCRFVLTDSNDIPKFVLGADEFDYSSCEEFINYLNEADIEELENCFQSVLNGKHVFTILTHIMDTANPRLIRTVLDWATEKNCLILQTDYQIQKTDSTQSVLNSLIEQFFHFIVYKSGNLDKWSKLINDKLGDNAQVICDIYPSAKDVIGEKPALKKISNMETKRRYFSTIRDFISLFPKRDLPVIFLVRNTHLADTDTFEFVKECILSNELSYFWLFCDYHLNSLLDSPPLLHFIEQNKEIKSEIKILQLRDLDPEDISTIIMDKFLWSSEESVEIAQVMYQKTMGNPYFLDQLFKRCFLEQIFHLDYDVEMCVCDIGALHRLELSRNVVDTLIDKIKDLDETKKKILYISSCIGKIFNFHILKRIGGFEETEIKNNMQYLVSGEFLRYHSVSETENIYEFTHDKLLQACYEMQDDQFRDVYHAKLVDYYHYLYSEIYLKSGKELNSIIFQIVGHINAIKDANNLKNFAKLKYQFNLLAGKKSQESSSYSRSFEYYKIAISPFLSEKPGSYQPEDFFSAIIEAADLALLNDDLFYLNNLIQIGLEYSQTTFEKVRLLEIRMRSQISRNELQNSLETGLQCIELLGMKLPQNPTKLTVLTEYLRTRQYFRSLSWDNLENLTPCDDRDKKILINILLLMSVSAYITKPYLLAIIVFRAIKIITKECPPEGIHFFAGYAMILCGPMKDIKSGYKIGNLALKLLDKFQMNKDSAKTYFTLYAFVMPWKRPLSSSLMPLLEAYRTAIETGDPEYSANSAVTYTYMAFFTGEKLDSLMAKINDFNQMMQKHNQTQIYLRSALWQQGIKNFYQSNANPMSLSGSLFEEEESLKEITQQQNKTAIFDFCLIKMLLGVYFYCYDEAYTYIKEARTNIGARTGSIVIAYFYFLESLILLNLSSKGSKLTQVQRVLQVKRNQGKLLKWANLNPANFLNKFYLVEAEKNKVLKNYLLAEEFFEKSIKAANEYSFQSEEALAKEMLAKLYIEKGIFKMASILLEEAVYSYRSWLADNKVSQLRNFYPDLFVDPKVLKESSTISTTSRKDREFFEIDAIVKTYKAISGEVNSNNLLKKLVSIILQNSGANRGVLLLNEDKKVFVKTDANVEDEEPCILEGIDYLSYPRLPHVIIKRIIREQNSIVIDNVLADGIFYEDIYFQTNQIKSLLCIPIQNKSTVQGYLYLENHHVYGAFSRSKLPLLELIASQFAASLETALLYKDVEQSEEKFRTLVDNLQDGVFIIQDDKIQYVNKGLLDLVGMRYEEMVGKNYTTLVTPKDLENVKKNNKLRLAGEIIPQEYEINILNREGIHVPVILNAGIITYNNRDAVEGTIKDITERKDNENLQKKYNEELKIQIAEKTRNIKNLLDHAGQGFLTFDADLLIEEEYSKECFKIFNEDITQRDFVELVFADAIEDEKKTNSDILKQLFTTTNKLTISAYFAILPEETVFNDRFLKLEYKMIDDLSKKKIMVILTDVTDKKFLEQEMESERNVQKMIVKAISDSSLIKKSINEYKHYFQEELKNIIYSESNYLTKISEIYRKIHTFKGDFAQWNMTYVASMLMKVEDVLAGISQQEGELTLDVLSSRLSAYDFEAWINSEMNLIKEKIGRDIFDDTDTLIVDKNVVYQIEDFILINFPMGDYAELLQKVRQLRYFNLKDCISGYSEYLNQLAESLGKLINPLEVEGDNIFLDYDIYYDFTKIIIHIFRNMIDHGIEEPDIRLEELNKSEAGTIRCTLKKSIDKYFTLTLSDDGSGIDLAKIRKKITDQLQSGKIEPKLLSLQTSQGSNFDVNLLDDEALLEFLFEDGFSTKERVTAISGRGVGLGAVKQEIEKLQGTIKIKSEPLQGTSFIIKIPIIEKSYKSQVQLKNIIEAFETQLLSFFTENIDISLSKADTITTKNCNIDLNPVSAFIDIRGMVKTRVLISFTNEFGIETLHKLLSDTPTPEEETELMHSTIAEVLNIILGNSLEELEEQNIYLKISAPVIITGIGTQFCQSGQKCYQMKYGSRLGTILVIFIYDEMM